MCLGAQVLCQHYSCLISCVDVQSLRVDQYGEVQPTDNLPLKPRLEASGFDRAGRWGHRAAATSGACCSSTMAYTTTLSAAAPPAAARCGIWLKSPQI
eukprot:COSAG04_NODE_2909_length_3395_cov_17.167779_3_plen_98_part_00